MHEGVSELNHQKEDYKNIGMINKPVTLFFEPLSLDVQFEKSLKFQIAIFRLSAEEVKGNKRAVKMDKTDPVKYTNPQEKITFSKALILQTTLPFNSETNAYESKEVDFEMAIEIDGKKDRVSKKINLKDVLLAKHKTYKISQQSPMILLTYRAEVKLDSEKQIVLSQKKIEEPKKSAKIIRFDDEISSTKENVRDHQQQNVQRKPQRVQKGRYKTVFFEPSPLEVSFPDTREEGAGLKKYKSQKMIREVQETQIKSSKNINSQFEEKSKEYKERCVKLEGKLGILQKSNQELQKLIKQKDIKLNETLQRNEELELKIQSQIRNFKKQKEEIKKQHNNKFTNDSLIINQLKNEIKQYQSQIQKLRKTALNFQESTKHIATGSQQEIRQLKQKITQLQRQSIQAIRQNEVLEQSMKNKDEIISDLKTKIYSLDKQNLEQQNKIKSLQVKMAKSKQQFEQELEELQNKISQMKEDNKNFKIATLKDIKDDTNVDYKKKVQTLEKQLEKKEELLKRMTDMKKEVQNERNNQINSLKDEVLQLKEVIRKLESRQTTHGKQTSDIQMKIQLQKLKKEVQICRKNQKTLLIQKGKLQASNHTLQDDIVKSKCAIANILNAVQQTGNQKLITQVYSLTQ